MQSSVSVCFPAYNEVATVNEVLREASLLLEGSGLDYELIVCDDGSIDGTGQQIDGLAGVLPGLHVIHHDRNLGIRATFEHLYHESQKDFIFLNSTDRQWATSILLDMMPMASDWDIIIASRKRKPYGPWRMFISWIFNFLPFILFHVKTYDAGAVKLTRRKIIDEFQLISLTPFSEAERLIRAVKAGYRVTEFPVDVAARSSGTAQGVKWSVLRATLMDVARVYWALKTEKHHSS